MGFPGKFNSFSMTHWRPPSEPAWTFKDTFGTGETVHKGGNRGPELKSGCQDAGWMGNEMGDSQRYTNCSILGLHLECLFFFPNLSKHFCTLRSSVPLLYLLLNVLVSDNMTGQWVSHLWFNILLIVQLLICIFLVLFIFLLLFILYATSGLFPHWAYVACLLAPCQASPWSASSGTLLLAPSTWTSHGYFTSS